LYCKNYKKKVIASLKEDKNEEKIKKQKQKVASGRAKRKREIIKELSKLSVDSLEELLQKVELKKMRIFLVRHGESQANVEKNIHLLVPDHDIALTNEGMDQALESGKVLKSYLEKYPAKPDFGNQMAQQFVSQIMGGLSSMVSNNPMMQQNPEMMKRLQNQQMFKARLWNSPYRRARETSRIISGQIKDQILDEREDVLLCEQQFGLFDGLSREEIAEKFPQENKCFQHQRQSNGKFWARYPQGESAFDVACRLRQFFGTIKRDEQDKQVFDVVVVCHGTVLRLFAQMWLHKKWEWFGAEPGPGNCAIRLLEGNRDGGYIFGGYRGGKEWTYEGNKYDK
jgi:2,3-bisphosphoglycerate-dependent phosphoglycerate mutase